MNVNLNLNEKIGGCPYFLYFLCGDTTYPGSGWTAIDCKMQNLSIKLMEIYGEGYCAGKPLGRSLSGFYVPDSSLINILGGLL